MASTANLGDAPALVQKAPLSSHPAFTAIVALWFTTLLGIGTLVVPASVLEQAIGALGVDSVAPAASAPLGSTARALIALACGFGGLAFGLVIANVVKKRDVVPMPPRVLNVQHDLDEERFDSPTAAASDPATAATVPLMALTDEDHPVELFPQPNADRRAGARRVAELPVAADLRVAPRRIDELPSAFAPAPTVRRAQPASAPPGPIPVEDPEPLGDLGLVQLVERLGASLAARRVMLAHQTDGPGVASSPVKSPISGPLISPSSPSGVGAGEWNDSAEQAASASFGSLLELRRAGLTASFAGDDRAPSDLPEFPARLHRSA